MLITGGTGGIGRVLARHLVTAHGARRLLIVGRRGEVPGLAAELGGLGAEVTFAACDVSDRASLAKVIAAVPAAYPLTGVVHAAGVLDDAVVAALTPAQVEAALKPKLDGALWLHELTAHLPIRAFALFSSASGVFGAPGQGGYAAANAFLDALARHRRALGLPAVSLAWGPWSAEGGMLERLTATDVARLRRRGTEPLPAGEGLALFDASLAAGHPNPVLVKMDPTAAVPKEADGSVPALLSGFVPSAPGGADGSVPAAALESALAGRPAEEQEKTLTALVRAEAASTLGHAGRRGGRGGPGVQRPRVRLAGRRRTAQPAEPRDGPPAARDGAVRPPDAARARPADPRRDGPRRRARRGRDPRRAGPVRKTPCRPGSRPGRPGESLHPARRPRGPAARGDRFRSTRHRRRHRIRTQARGPARLRNPRRHPCAHRRGVRCRLTARIRTAQIGSKD
ncbi:SDR family NAD(P)-dependent oxidoreductase [Actinomadura madurae]|nr:beta-ketoacyl reductase [Actinomadura madurae]MCP9955765.1 SDR family NAD(P)-dependent oxidoreductase [Actinomadura madurae]